MKKNVNAINGYLSITIFLLLGSPLKGHAGLMVGGTRFIYHEGNEKGLSVLVRNTEDSQFLLQTKVLKDETQGNLSQDGTSFKAHLPFVATPPLLPLKGKKDNYIRLIRTEGALPSDRESLFQLSMASIPSGMPHGTDVQVALRVRYKLIYRPSGLKGAADQAYQQLLWQRHGSSVTVENPTPYYVTLFQMMVNGKSHPAEGVVAPFGSRTEPWCPNDGECRLKWQSLDDMGTPTPGWKISPSGKAEAGESQINEGPQVSLKH